MAFTRADMLATAERSPAAAGARDRKAWVGLFMSNGRVEDPVGSTPHRGIAAIGRFYDTFVGPRDIRFHPDVDIVVGPTVVRDGELEVTMASTVTLRVPAYIRFDLQDDAGELKIAALSAFWELPAMVGQFLRVGIRAVPAVLQLSRLLLTNQGDARHSGIPRRIQRHRHRIQRRRRALPGCGMRRRRGRHAATTRRPGTHLQRRRPPTERRRPAETSLRSAVAQTHRMRACRRRDHRACRAAQRDLHRGRF